MKNDLHPGLIYLRSRMAALSLMALLTAGAPLSAEAQDKSVSGTVKGSDGEGLPGVTVLVKGTTNGTQTDLNGIYQIDAPPDAVLVFSSVGLATQEILIGDKTVIDVTLVEEIKSLEEVVVVGYGTVKKKDATGAVAAIGAKDFQKGVIVAPEQLVQGRVAGVQITQTSGQPGGPINVRIRGTSSVYGANQPLFVVDGVPLGGDDTSSGSDAVGVGRQSAQNPLNFLNPYDIGSMDILKDASATAIYGSRGANGVVLITTKRGKGKGTLEYNSSIGVSTLTKRYDLLSADEYLAAGGVNQGSKTDWQKEVFRSGITNQHNFSYGGGDESGGYRFSFGYFDQQGIVKRSGFQRYSLGFSGHRKFIQDKLNISSSLNLADIRDASVPISENIGYEGDLLGSTLKANPTRPVFNADGTHHQVDISEPNPVAFLDLSKDNTKSLRALGNVSAEFEILKGFKFKTVLGFDKSFSSRKAAYSRDLEVQGITKIGRAYFGDVQVDNRLWENYFTYDKVIGKTTLNALLGYSYQRFQTDLKNAAAANFRTSDLDLMINNVASANAGKLGSNVLPNSNSIIDELQSFFGRVNAGFADKYLLTATLRVDGSSKFGANNKYGYFPSFAAKWKIINEDFMSKNFFDDLALRVSYGLTGNQAIPHNLFDRRDRYGDWKTNTGGDNVESGGLSAVAFNNPNLKWETTSAIDIGLDFTFLKGRLSGTVDFYQKNTRDLLFKIVSAQPAPNPFTWKNLKTDIQNRGVELTLVGTIIDQKDFGWELLFNTAYNHNMVTDLAGFYDTGEISGQGLTGAFAQRIAEGRPLFAYFMREFNGYGADGNSIYTKGDVQHFLDGNQSALPKVTGGLTGNFRYKNFDLSLFFNGVFGNYVYNNTANAYFTKGAFANGKNVTKDVVNSKEGNFNAPDVSTRFLEKGNFVRLQNLNLSYHVPLKSKVISNLRFFITGQNLWVFTKYKGQDPEVSTNKSLNDIPSFGIDYMAYPRARTWTIGANISF